LYGTHCLLIDHTSLVPVQRSSHRSTARPTARPQGHDSSHNEQDTTEPEPPNQRTYREPIHSLLCAIWLSGKNDVQVFQQSTPDRRLSRWLKCGLTHRVEVLTHLAGHYPISASCLVDFDTGRVDKAIELIVLRDAHMRERVLVAERR